MTKKEEIKLENLEEATGGRFKFDEDATGGDVKDVLTPIRTLGGNNGNQLNENDSVIKK